MCPDLEQPPRIGVTVRRACGVRCCCGLTTTPRWRELSFPNIVALLFRFDDTGEELLSFDLRVGFSDLLPVDPLGYLDALGCERFDEVHVSIISFSIGLNDARIGTLSGRGEGLQRAVNSLVSAFGDRRDHFVLRCYHRVLRLTDGCLRRRAYRRGRWRGCDGYALLAH